MPESIVAPYGSWKSPITSDFIVKDVVGLSEVVLEGKDTFWSEMRPAEGGRCVLVRQSADGRIDEITPPPFNARTRAHEYGGGAYTVVDGIVYFSNFTDQRIYRRDLSGRIQPVTPEGSLRFADAIVDRIRGCMYCVQEDHTQAGKEPVNSLVNVDLSGIGNIRVLVSGNHFYSSPRLSPDGTSLAWLTWNHPNMPWDGTELWVGKMARDGTLSDLKKVAGGTDESVFQPEWSPDGVLHFISDRSGWWNLYRLKDDSVEALVPMSADFGMPQWVFGMSTYAFESADRLVCTYSAKGLWQMALLDLKSLRLEELCLPYTQYAYVKAAPGKAVFCAGSPTESLAVVQLDLPSRKLQVLKKSSQTVIDDALRPFLSPAEPVTFKTENDQDAYALFYPPKNPDFKPLPGEKPPLVVKSHGGPTSAASSTLSWGIQYWTSRGFAVVDVNYGGSTGYGREYRSRLNGKWGIVDVDDCCNAALYLARQGKVDEQRMAITGGSAGGYTTLSALTFRKVFRTGASHYGVSDLEALVKDTHKFESRYLDTLIGPYPEQKKIYDERSPIHHTDQLSVPVIFLQGDEDRIVPPSQAECMVDALRKKGLPFAYLLFIGEQHGFRRAENIKRALDAELYFYATFLLQTGLRF
ncbi:MAG TPA: S9 family peptidase [Verrucomicrobiae bacterium]|nr:S9 family peptidase [Verrucomicrobiae bacterium]